MHPRHVYWRRRAVAIAVVVVAIGLPLAAFGRGGGDERDDRARAEGAGGERQAPPELPRGGRRIFPDHRVVAFYGAPQDEQLGVLGIGSPDRAARRLVRVARRYERSTRPVLPAMELIATVAAAHPGEDGRYNLRQPAEVIDRYLGAARRAGALLVLDIQPGHEDFLVEARRLQRWLREPDVGLALDPEWHTPGQVPGSHIGSVDARTINAVSMWLSRIVERGNLPEKLFVVHQFTADMIRDKHRVEHRRGLAITMNVDGFGDRPNKLAKYREFTTDGTDFHDGIKLFLEEDTDLMSPRAVLGLSPPPDLVVYE